MQEKQSDIQSSLLQEAEDLHTAYQLFLQDPAMNCDGLIQIRDAALHIADNPNSAEYSLAQNVARSLHGLTDGLTEFNTLNLGIIKAHVDALKAIFKDDIKGEGDATGQELLQELQSVVTSSKG